MNTSKILSLIGAMALLVLPSACGGGSSTTSPPPPEPEADITITGSIMDGPVSGGRVYVFDAASVAAARANATSGSSRAEALTGSSPLAVLHRSDPEDASYSITLPAETAGKAVFVVFDNEGARDQAFNDRPFNLDSLAVLGAAGSSQHINLTPHTTMVSRQVERRLGTTGFDNSAASIQAEIRSASEMVVAAVGRDEYGASVIDESSDLFKSTDVDELELSSNHLGALVRTLHAMNGLPRDVVLSRLAFDAADGVIDGVAPAAFALSAGDSEQVAIVGRDFRLNGPRDVPPLVSSCSSAMTELGMACEFEVLDEFFLALAACADTSDRNEHVECEEEAQQEREEANEECDDRAEVRAALCEDIDDAAYDPAFGPDFAEQFVDPVKIGVSVAPNNYLPLVQGNFWRYEGTSIEDGEEITETIDITVTTRTKLIDGIRCVVVRDVVMIDGELVEDTDDWFAQDVDGNIWYCGEEAKDYELFDGDDPRLPELVAIDGSFKSGREGDKAGMLMPNLPEIGSIIRTEVSLGNAEDVIRVESVTGSATSTAASCEETCLVTYDYSTLDPEAQENKYYAPGVGLILEVDLENNDSVRLIEYGNSIDSP